MGIGNEINFDTKAVSTEDIVIDLSKNEQDFLIDCIFMAAGEGYYLFDRDNKYEDMLWEDIIKLFKKIGATEEDVEKLESI